MMEEPYGTNLIEEPYLIKYYIILWRNPISRILWRNPIQSNMMEEAYSIKYDGGTLFNLIIMEEPYGTNMVEEPYSIKYDEGTLFDLI
jgi:hypothetical protein